MKIALVMTIRNEQPVLRRNLRYHRFLGVDVVYLYLDRCSDGSEASIRDLSYVRVAPSVGPEGSYGWRGARRYVEHYEDLGARESLNAFDALCRARDEGIDWLIHLDADELVCPHAGESRPEQLRSLLAGLGSDVESVRFLPFEVCPRRLECDHAFAEETLFIAPDARGSRTLYDPIRNESFSAGLALGHRKGKSAVRVAEGVVPQGPHEFRRRGAKPLRSLVRPYLLHFYVWSFDQFLRKFRNHAERPDTWMGGDRVDRTKLLWRDMVNGSRFSREELREYFQRWVLLPEAEIRRGQQEGKLLGVRFFRPSVVEITAARKTFAQLGE